MEGWLVTRIEHDSSFIRGQDAAGQIIVEAPEPLDAWVIEFSAPSRDGYSSITALVVVDAADGEVKSADVARSNPLGGAASTVRRRRAPLPTGRLELRQVCPRQPGYRD